MNKLIKAFLLVLLSATLSYAGPCDTTVGGHEQCSFDITDWYGLSEPSISSSGQGRMYFDSTANDFKCSKDGGAYETCGGSVHDEVTLAADADVLMSLFSQEIGFDNQDANKCLCGPATGAASDPTVRALVDADIPDDITITEADTLQSVTDRGATSDQNLILSGFVSSTGGLEIAGGYFKVKDDRNLSIGTGDEWVMRYWDSVDDQLLLSSTKVGAIAITDPMFEILVNSGTANGTGMTVNQEIFGISKGTQASNVSLFTVDAEGDVLIAGGLNSDALTASEIVITDASKNLVSAAVANYPSLAELAYVKGATSAIQTQLTKLHTFVIHKTLEIPTDADSFIIASYVPLASTITKIRCIAEAATSATIRIDECDTAGDSCAGIDGVTTIVCPVTGQDDDGDLSNAGIDVGDTLRMVVTATSGTPEHVTVTIMGTRN